MAGLSAGLKAWLAELRALWRYVAEPFARPTTSATAPASSWETAEPLDSAAPHTAPKRSRLALIERIDRHGP